ncbi:hypothetical protein BDQ17DRAFT_1254180, partial [Cyathus striatus]
ICINHGFETTVQCINAVGTTSAALPSSTSVVFSPSANAVEDSDSALILGPQGAWNTTNANLNCNFGTTIQTTDVINASISLNFTGRAILINAISSPHGGVFSVIFDGVLLRDTIDTFNSEGESCFVRQFPPFKDTPTNLALTLDHSIVLVHQGPSNLAPNGSLSSVVQFESFAIPQFTTTSGAIMTGQNAYMLTSLICQ